ncbi:MAG: hypothetical protein COV74_10490 [Candidatus Omnitrophica bacterium CG11_big_fil_rev_8_21_14_0_20_45_26]|uniref:Transporter n=1 Tax=Candidatus Abzuiibacterium crystallinum TaxID=1974748 RepID=A0A2H0LKY8_9BACT|nr:MAG: hypothetical protein COV74_10490 [Candidatus Omnitrophica bacterium CG11_big_fil_rev_8_21_14_0_20_45_26]PIW63906.1 MAG: hypothetical protein COW12_08325 [Candidatus Omnitrophica bacterium CG12_big_fil_rev_8_21_14_0_65_45_16]
MKNLTKIMMGLSIACFGASGLSWSQTDSVPRSIELTSILTEALAHNPDIQSTKAEWQASRKKVWQETALPDPMVGMDLMGEMTETRVGPQENRMMVSQEIPFPLKLIKKGQIANDEARAAEMRYLATVRDTLNEISKLYYDLYYTDASIAVIEEVKTILKHFESVAQSRYANLKASQRDVAKAQAEVSLVLEQLFSLEQKRHSLAAQLNAWLDRDPMGEVGQTVLPEKPTLPQSIYELVEMAVKHREEIKAMEAMVQKSYRERTLARLEWIPDLNVGFSYTWVGSGETTSANDGQDSWMFPLRINVPIWQNRIIPKIQETNELIKANEAKLTEAKNQAYYEVKDAYYRYDSAAKIVELYETAILPQAELVLRSDQAGYEGGEADFLNLLDSERVYLNAKLTHVRLVTELFKSYLDIERSTGLDLERHVSQTVQTEAHHE